MLCCESKCAAAGGEPAIAGKPAVLATVRGGSYAAGAPREGWDREQSAAPIRFKARELPRSVRESAARHAEGRDRIPSR